jgi:methylmalonyl-CoA/ethylmalonyl-CoA epimerase
MGIERISHIGIAVRQWDQQVAFYQDVLGLKLLQIEEVPEQKVRVAMFQVGEVVIELLGPLSEDSPVGKFLEKQGEGLHHLAYLVQDLAGTLQSLSEKGVALVDKTPRPGAHGHRIAFLHPRSTFGVLTELCE